MLRHKILSFWILRSHFPNSANIILAVFQGNHPIFITYMQYEKVWEFICYPTKVNKEELVAEANVT